MYSQSSGENVPSGHRTAGVVALSSEDDAETLIFYW